MNSLPTETPASFAETLPPPAPRQGDFASLRLLQVQYEACRKYFGEELLA